MFKKIFVVLIISLTCTATSRADLVIGNLGNSVNGGALLNNLNQLAFKFTMGSEALFFDNAILTLENIGALLPAPVVTLKTGNTANPPAAGILLTNTTTPALGRIDYTFIAPPTTVLEANQTYWIHVMGVVSWETSATLPAGPLATNNGFRVTNDAGVSWNDYSQPFNGLLSINGSPVPEPAGAMLLALGGLLVIVRRQR